MSHKCEHCDKSYVWKKHLYRHWRQKHSDDLTKAKQDGGCPYNAPRRKEDEAAFAFKHPFVMMIAAPAGEGKTWFVKKRLENRIKFIQPPPNRILWLYHQWQSLYKEMHCAIGSLASSL